MLRYALVAMATVALLAAAPARAADVVPITLRAAIDRALAANRDLRQADALVTGAEAGIRIAGVRPNANLSIDALKVRPTRGFAGDRPDTVVRLEQTFERGDKRELRLAQAGSLLEAAQSDRSDTLRQLRSALASAYWQLKSAEAAVALAESDRQSYARLIELARLRLSVGDLAGTDLARIEAEAARASTDADLLQTQRRDQQVALAVLLADESRAGVIATVDEWPQPTEEPPADIDAVVERRPDVIAARARLDAAARQIELARAQRTRDVTVGVQVERDETRVNSVGLGISVPIFTGNDFSGDIAAAIASETSAQIALEQVRSAALAELDRLRVRLDVTAAAARRYRDEIVPGTDRATAGVRFAYENGAATLLDLLDALRSQRATRRAAADAYVAHATARSAWQAALNLDATP